MNKYEIRYIRALNQFFEEMIYDEEQFNNILVTIYNNKELKQLVNRLTDKEDNEDAYCEFILQVAEIKDKQKLIISVCDTINDNSFAKPPKHFIFPKVPFFYFDF